MCGWSAAAACWRSRSHRPERRNAITVAMYAALADAIERRRGRREHPGRSPSAARARISPPATTSPISSPRAARRRGDSGLAPAARAGRMRNADHRRGPRQLRRHRHDHAASLRPGDCGRKRALLDAVRRPRRWFRKRQARCCFRGWRGGGGPRATCCWREPFGADEALAIGLVSHRCAAEVSMRSSRNWLRLAGQAA